MQKFTKGLVQITDLLEPPPLYNGLWGGGGGGGSKKFLLEIVLFANKCILVKDICRKKYIYFKNAKNCKRFGSNNRFIGTTPLCIIDYGGGGWFQEISWNHPPP